MLRRISAQLCVRCAWPTRTPFGDEVEPDVYCTKATPASGSGGARRTSPSMGTDGLVRDARTRSNPRGNAPSRAPTRRSMEIHRRVLGVARPRGVDFLSRRPRSRRLARATRARAAACAAAYARVVMTMRASASRARVSKSESCARSFASAADGSGGYAGTATAPDAKHPNSAGRKSIPGGNTRSATRGSSTATARANCASASRASRACRRSVAASTRRRSRVQSWSSRLAKLNRRGWYRAQFSRPSRGWRGDNGQLARRSASSRREEGDDMSVARRAEACGARKRARGVRTSPPKSLPEEIRN